MNKEIFTSKVALGEVKDASLSACLSWLKEDVQGGTKLIDPVDNVAVDAHYGDSHLAAALIILGHMERDKRLFDQGLSLVRTIVRRWPTSSQLDEFHHDFNSFALCLIDEYLVGISTELSNKIRELVLSTRDSTHTTINWLPMRAYTNRSRYEWTGDKRYLKVFDRALHAIRQATNDDGGIEDRLPVGSSYNLQYNISSVATLQLLSKRWPAVELDVRRELDFLLGKLLPDGDINFMGRGTNQIFGWGPWLYVLSATEKADQLRMSLDFLGNRYARALERRNIFLNDFLGSEKSFWWDYHFCSVYHAHFLLWCSLALRDFGSAPSVHRRNENSGTGLTFETNELGGVCIFQGRSIYLAEAGPALSAIWLSGKGLLFKGGLGPWQGMFGKRYSVPDAVINNHFGLIRPHLRAPSLWGRMMSRFGRTYSEDRQINIRPIFASARVEREPDHLSVLFETPELSAYLNVPIFKPLHTEVNIEMSVDGRRLEGSLLGTSRNQYGWISVTRSQLAKGRRWKVELS